jgi:redox-sensitive bicupin YhaK (pirin superfamily)
MRHKDNAGHEGVIEPGGIQWMTAGKGIVHSEMPEQENGMLEGFQLWINLPANNKMDEPAYQEYPADRIPLEHREGGVEVRVIAGVTSQETRGPVLQPLTDPLYLDVSVPYGKDYFEELPELHNAFLYVISGSVSIEDEAGSLTTLDRDDLGVLTRGKSFQLHADKEDVRFLLVAGRPLREPVARGGPFVMNTKAEILKAFDDYKNGEI